MPIGLPRLFRRAGFEFFRHIPIRSPLLPSLTYRISFTRENTILRLWSTTKPLFVQLSQYTTNAKMDVQLYVYDLSQVRIVSITLCSIVPLSNGGVFMLIHFQGLARSMSRQFLGIQIDAVYHTSIVLNSVEYFFGQGVQTYSAGTTHHGRPMEIVKLGQTALPVEIILEYLESLKEIYTAEVRCS